MKHQIVPRLSRGFTLIELLVVIAIIIILASVGFGVGASAINTAKKTVAKNDCVGLITAIDGFYDEYQRLPGTAGGADTETETNSEFMNILLGFDEDENENAIRFFTGKEATGRGADTAIGGLFYDGRSAELFDPWRRGDTPRNRHYFVLLDGNFDEELTSPFGGKTLYGKRALSWSVGKDGEAGSGTDSKTRDNVYSWK